MQPTATEPPAWFRGHPKTSQARWCNSKTLHDCPVGMTRGLEGASSDPPGPQEEPRETPPEQRSGERVSGDQRQSMAGSASEPKSLTAARKGSEARSSMSFWRALLGVCCLGFVCIILVAGLWPFHRPKNDVEWLPGENGLRFGHRGIVVSSAAFKTDAPASGCTLEIYLRPAGTSGAGTILALDDNPEPKDVFGIRQ